MLHKPERLRATSSIRVLLKENSLRAEDFVLPIFLNEEKSNKKEIASMPGVAQWSVAESLKFVEEQVKVGIHSFMLFGIVPASRKDKKGSAGWDAKGPVPRALELYKKEFGDKVTLFADTCFCEYTEHGHCGTFVETKKPGGAKAWQRDREKTLSDLGRAAVLYAEAGADVIAPSGMVDGMVGSIRAALDKAGHDTSICSYSVKYASAFYGPFREAAENAPASGSDRKGYQMDPANRREALREAQLDACEGADMLLVKPAGHYLDIVSDVREHTKLPVGAYQVSGEYSMIMAAAQAGWISEEAAFMESLVCIKRAGAQFIISYWAPQAAKILGGAKK